MAHDFGAYKCIKEKSNKNIQFKCSNVHKNKANKAIYLS